MPWRVEIHPEFAAEFDDLSEAVQDAVLAHMRLLAASGPTLGRPAVDT